MDLLAGSWSGTTDSKPNVWTFEPFVTTLSMFILNAVESD